VPSPFKDPPTIIIFPLKKGIRNMNLRNYKNATSESLFQGVYIRILKKRGKR